MQNEKSLQQLIKEYESNMPPEIMQLIQSFDWKREVRTIVNQNQLMIDIGADLEESIYLMILGVIQVEDLYDRLQDVHEIPEDKTRKIIEEIETLIFKPLHEKLMKIEDTDLESSSSSTAPTSHRDEILAEIEKEPEPLIKLNLSQTPQTNQFASMPPVSASAPQPVQTQPDPGVTKPFTIASTQAVASSNPPIESGTIIEDAKGDPVKTTLQNPTITVNPDSKPKVQDPYREPIE